MRIIEWNINQATNICNTLLPEFVINEVLNKSPDIFILTEFAKTRNYNEIIQKIKNAGFDFECTDNSRCKQNDVLIAWKDVYV